MKIYAIMTAVLTIAMIFFPLLSLSTEKNNTNEKTTEYTSETQQQATKTATSSEQSIKTDTIKLLRVSSDKIIDLEMFEYLVGSVAAEMPASFKKEALKAQTVACYSYALWIKENADNTANALYDISDNPAVHQGYLDSEDLKEKWGKDYEKNLKIIKDAVNSVMGEYLTYGNEPAMCIYHAISAGKTQSAKNAWGNDVPYLQSVTAPGDALSPDIDSVQTFTYSELEKKLNIKNIAKSEIKIETSENGYVKKLTLGKHSLSGIETASALELSSPCFTVKKRDSGYTFSVKGKGHGIGMSQYSAQYMARQGSTYDEILAHFYSGTTLIK